MRTIMPFLLATLLAAAFAQAQQHGEEKRDRAPKEIVRLHTERSETSGATGSTHRATKIYTKRTYHGGNGKWSRIDLSPRAENFRGFSQAVRSGEYISRFDPDNPKRGLRFERGEYYVTYTPAGEWTGRTVRLKHTVTGVKETVVLSLGAEMTVRWTVETNARAELRNGGLVFRDMSGKEVFRVPEARAWDANEREIAVTSTFTEGMFSCVLDAPPDAAWPLMLDPTTVLAAVDDIDDKTGALIGVGDTFAEARDTTMAYNNPETLAWVGILKNTEKHSVHRTALSFDTSVLPDAAIIDSARVILVTSYDGTDLEFNMKLVAGVFSGSWSRAWYNDFVGWNPGAVYGVTTLSNTLNTSTCHTAGDTCRFTLNTAGRDSINVRGETRFMLLAEHDINNQGFMTNYQERLGFEEDSPCIMVWYRLPVCPPSSFTMTSLDSATVVCTWNDMSDNEQTFLIVNQADYSVVDSIAANATADTIRGLSMNTRYIWAAAADSGGVRTYSEPDTAWTFLNPPQPWQAHIAPLGSDTLRVTVDAPANSGSGLTGMEVGAVSGPGATGSGWLTGTYSFRDGGLDPDSSYVYRVRFRNGAGDSTDWTPDLRFTMRGRTSLVLPLAGDAYDDCNVNFGEGARDSTVVRAGRSDTGERLDGFLSFELPWEVQKGGVDSMFVTLTRTAEQSGTTPALTVYALPVKDVAPVETLSLGAQDSTAVSTIWTVTGGTGSRKSPNLRNLFQAWRELSPNRDLTYGFGLRLDDGGAAESVRAVFLDASNPSYDGDTKLTIYYTPGAPDTLRGTPEDFTLTVLAPDSIRADWTDGAAGEYGYVLLDLPDSTVVAGTDTLASDAETVTVGGLIPNTIHQWAVKAFTTIDGETTAAVSARTLSRTPGKPAVTACSSTAMRFVIDPRDNPAPTEFAVQDSVSGWFVDADAAPHVLRAQPLGEWGWRTFAGWGAAQGDSLSGLGVNEEHGLRVKAR